MIPLGGMKEPVVIDRAPYRAHYKHYEKRIYPLRERADAGRGSYDEYDERYDEWLEELATMIQHDLLLEYQRLSPELIARIQETLRTA